MLTLIERNHFFNKKISSAHLPLSYYEQHLEQIDWSVAERHLPLDFYAKYAPEKERKCGKTAPSGLLFPWRYEGLLSRQEFEEIMASDARDAIIANPNIPTEWFEPYLHSFIPYSDNWALYLNTHPLTDEQFALYGWPHHSFNHLAKLSWIPYEEQNFCLLFSHPQLTIEFIQEHLQDALAHYMSLIRTEVGHQLALECCIDSQEPILKHNLPAWFIDEYRNSVNYPPNATAAWLKERRPKVSQPTFDAELKLQQVHLWQTKKTLAFL